MSVIPVGYAESVSEFSVPGDAGPAMVVLGHNVGGLSTMLDILNAIEDAWTLASGMLEGVSDQYSLEEIRVTWKRDSGDPVLGLRSVNTAGGSTTSPLPPQSALLFHKSSELAGRKNRGRMYLPGPVESAFDDGGFIVPASFTNWSGRAAGFMAELSANGAAMVILHTDPADPPSEVTFLDPATKLATQRRRLR